MTTQLVRQRQTAILETPPRPYTATGQHEFMRELSNKTAWLVTNRIDPLIRDAVSMWDQTITNTHITWLISPKAPLPGILESADRGTVEMVEDLAETLRLPVSSILKATGIAQRTFYDWKRSPRRPRVNSVGQLWGMAQLVEDLATVHQDVAKWLHARPVAMEALLAGDFDTVAGFDLRQKTFIPPLGVPGIGAVGPEPDLPLTKGTPLSGFRRIGRSGRRRRPAGGPVSE